MDSGSKRKFENFSAVLFSSSLATSTQSQWKRDFMKEKITHSSQSSHNAVGNLFSLISFCSFVFSDFCVWIFSWWTTSWFYFCSKMNKKRKIAKNIELRKKSSFWKSREWVNIWWKLWCIRETGSYSLSRFWSIFLMIYKVNF